MELFLKEKASELKERAPSAATNTIRDYRYHLDGLISWLSARRFRQERDNIPPTVKKSDAIAKFKKTIKIKEITRDSIESFLNQRTKAGKSPSTISTWLYTFKSFYQLVSKPSMGKISNPVKEIIRKPPKYSKTPSIQAKQTGKILAALKPCADDSPFVFRDKMFYWTMLKFGLRMKETLSLTQAHLKISAEHLVLSIKGKGNASRILPLPVFHEVDSNGTLSFEEIPGNAEYLNSFKEYIEGDNGLLNFMRKSTNDKKDKNRSYIFPSKHGSQLSHDSARNSFNRIIAETHLDSFGYTPMTLRNTAIINWIKAGVAIETVSRLAGHASLTTTQKLFLVDSPSPLGLGSALAKSL